MRYRKMAATLGQGKEDGFGEKKPRGLSSFIVRTFV